MVDTTWAIIGAGRFATDRMVPAILSAPGSRIAGVWARNSTAARSLADAVGSTNYPSFAALTDSKVDIAYVAVTAEANPGLVVPLLEAGIPVLCEKPVAATVAAARHLADVAMRLGVPCFVNHHLRVNDAMSAAKTAVGSGMLGRIRQLQISNHQLMPQPPGWRLSDPTSGGVVRDLTIHDIDLAMFLLDEPLQVRTAKALERQHNVETATEVTITTPSGIEVGFSDGWVTPPGNAYSRLTIIGEDGSLTVDRAVTAVGSRLTLSTAAGQNVRDQTNDAYKTMAQLAIDGARGATVPIANTQSAAETIIVLDEILTCIDMTK